MEEVSVIAVAGPTAAGKTEIALELASKLDAEIVSADAFQVYCYMDIGTAKLPVKKRLNPLHHMIDVCHPEEEYSVIRYQKEARSCIENIVKRGKKAIICGGTPLYLVALLFNIEIPPEKKVPGLREELLQTASTNPKALIEKLKSIDPEALLYINPSNLRRIIRAIELYEQAGVKYSELYRRWKSRSPYYRSRILWVYREREELYKLIEERVEKMMINGFVDEVNFLRENFKLSKTALQAIGYKEIYDYLNGKISLDEAVELIKKKTRNYAKRQISWFRNDPGFVPVDISGYTTEEAVEKIMNRYLV